MINVDHISAIKIMYGHLETDPGTDYGRNKTGETKDCYVIDDGQSYSTHFYFKKKLSL
jgi:hypothetical protein